jgi:hypothetical protein
VAPHVTESGKRGWRWTCSDHPRHRGHHQLQRWTDWVRANRDDPDDHAFVRCMRGASDHWHKLHAPEHHCCPIAYNQRKENAMTKKDPRTPEEKAAWEAGEFTEKEAAEAGMTKEEMNAARAQQEGELGNPLAPPS